MFKTVYKKVVNLFSHKTTKQNKSARTHTQKQKTAVEKAYYVLIHCVSGFYEKELIK